MLSGFAAGKEDLFSCRIEAVEDLDALVRVQETWVERNCQIKLEGVFARCRGVFVRANTRNKINGLST